MPDNYIQLNDNIDSLYNENVSSPFSDVMRKFLDIEKDSVQIYLSLLLLKSFKEIYPSYYINPSELNLYCRLLKDDFTIEDINYSAKLVFSSKRITRVNESFNLINKLSEYVKLDIDNTIN